MVNIKRLTIWPAGIFLTLLLVMAACKSQIDDEAASSTPTLPPPPMVQSTPTTEEMAGAGYPAPTADFDSPAAGYPSLPPTGYPDPQTPIPTATPAASNTTIPVPLSTIQSYLPQLFGGLPPTPTPTNTPQPTPTATPTIDFAVVRSQLEAQGLNLVYNKIGFHVGAGGNRVGLGDWMRQLDAAGVPFFLKSADDAGALYEAQEIMRASGVPHTLVYRRSGNEYDTPNYDLSPQEAARQHWQLHKDAFPPELDPSVVWIETINEVDKERSEWLAQFALETANLAMADGFRWAAFGWSSGEPEVDDWQGPSMVQFLRLAAANPDRLAIALHEYSFLKDDISHQYPFKVGRFQQLFEVVDQLGIPRPTVLITEWGWEYQDVPSAGKAMEDIDWAASLYAPYPEIKGAAIWYLGIGFDKIADKAQPLIKPVTRYSLGNYFSSPIAPERAPINPELYRP